MPRSYGQFCPIAKASEVLGDRWTPLVLRELMFGSERFNDIQRGVPRMSRSLLAQRLRELEESGIITSTPDNGARGHAYRLTEAGASLRPILEQLGFWALEWGIASISEGDLDDRLMMWALRHRALTTEHNVQAVVQFDLRGVPGVRGRARTWWIIIDGDNVDVCDKDPGFEVTVLFSADLRELTRVYLGMDALADARRRGSISIEGDAFLAGTLPAWLGLDRAPTRMFVPRRGAA